MTGNNLSDYFIVFFRTLNNSVITAYQITLLIQVYSHENPITGFNVKLINNLIRNNPTSRNSRNVQYINLLSLTKRGYIKRISRGRYLTTPQGRELAEQIIQQLRAELKEFGLKDL